MTNDNKIKNGDRVKVIKAYKEYGEEHKGDEILIEATGTVIGIDENYQFPYQIRFDDEKVEKYSNKQGTLLFKREQLEFHFDEIKVEERLDEDVCN